MILGLHEAQAANKIFFINSVPVCSNIRYRKFERKTPAIIGIITAVLLLDHRNNLKENLSESHRIQGRQRGKTLGSTAHYYPRFVFQVFLVHAEST